MTPFKLFCEAYNFVDPAIYKDKWLVSSFIDFMSQPPYNFTGEVERTAETKRIVMLHASASFLRAFIDYDSIFLKVPVFFEYDVPFKKKCKEYLETLTEPHHEINFREVLVGRYSLRTHPNTAKSESHTSFFNRFQKDVETNFKICFELYNLYMNPNKRSEECIIDMAKHIGMEPGEILRLKMNLGMPLDTEEIRDQDWAHLI